MKKFFLTLVISFIVFGAAAAMINADMISRSVSGGERGKLFSYTVESCSNGRLEIFGQIYKIDRLLTRDIIHKCGKIISYGTQTLPNSVLLFGEALSNSFSGLADAVISNGNHEILNIFSMNIPPEHNVSDV